METNVIIEILTEQHELLKKIAKGQDNTKAVEVQQPDYERINSLTKELQDAVESARRPIIQERRWTIDLKDNAQLWRVMAIYFVNVLLCAVTLYCVFVEESYKDNDLKYRYIMMRGGAGEKLINQFEDIFELNRDDELIRSIRKDVEEFEAAVKRKAKLDEQNRLRALESAELDAKAKAIKSGK